MALSQLSGYISDEEEAQVFGESEKVKAIDSGNKVNRKAKKNFFSLPQTESSGSSTDSDSDTEEKEVFKHKVAEVAPEQSLPKPKFDTPIVASFHSWQGDSSASVFKNPFRLEEEAQISALSRHVQLTDSVAFDSQSSKAICKLYRRGLCRRGDKCRFAHTLPGGLKANQAATEVVTEATASVGAIISAPPCLKGDKERFFDSNDQPDPFEAQPKGDTKKRVGVTNSLVPPKKALVAFDKQRKAKGNSLA